MRKIIKTPLAVTIGTTLFAGLSSPAINADTNLLIEVNPFAMKQLSGGYMQTAEADAEQAGAMKMKDGSCGEGKCGDKMAGKPAKAKEGQCGDKKSDGAAQADEMKKGKEGKCGDKKTDGEVKAKEGSCGDKKANDQ